MQTTARRIAAAKSVAVFEDLGVQMNRHSTLVSYLHWLLVLLTGNFGKPGAAYRPTTFVPLASESSRGGERRTPVTGARIIGGLTPCNVIPEEILTDHPKRFRALLVESGNPAHSLADSTRMREALAALELVVVIDIAFTETARLADYVLPVASQFEKAEATFFNFEFPRNYFHLRKALMKPLPGLFSEAELHSRLVEALGALPAGEVAALRAAWQEGRAVFRAKFFELVGADPRLIGVAPVVLYRAIGDLLPEGLAEGAGFGRLANAAQRQRNRCSAPSSGTIPPSRDALFRLLLSSKRGCLSVERWRELRACEHPTGAQPHCRRLFEELTRSRSSPRRRQRRVPLVLSAVERRSFTANTIIAPRVRRKDRRGALRMHPDDARRLGVAAGGGPASRPGGARVGVRRDLGPHEARPRLASERLGLDFPDASGSASRRASPPTS